MLNTNLNNYISGIDIKIIFICCYNYFYSILRFHLKIIVLILCVCVLFLLIFEVLLYCYMLIVLLVLLVLLVVSGNNPNSINNVVSIIKIVLKHLTNIIIMIIINREKLKIKFLITYNNNQYITKLNLIN